MQYKDNLSAAQWTDLGAPVSATGPAALKVDQNNGTRRFYQVVLLP